LSMGHGRAIINIEDRKAQLEIYERILSQNLSVRQAEELVRNYHSKKPLKKSATATIPEFVSKNVTHFSDFFQTKVQVQVAKNGKGKIVIPFGSEEDFKRLKKLIKGDS